MQVYRLRIFYAISLFSGDLWVRVCVVILGAGASKAAFPDGDKSGRKLPVMKDFVETVGLGSLLNKYKINWSNESDFEELYSQLYTDGNNQELLGKLEYAIYKYFSVLELPETPTLYDHLILSLREKDVIATFNWDPFLWKACERVFQNITTKVPKLFFLHGNVAISIDKECKRKRSINFINPKTNQQYPASQLLYPIAEKNYTENQFIASEWFAVQKHLERASILTIFGYGAPKSDVEAMRLLAQGWGSSSKRVLEQVELIDTKEKNELLETWEPFIFQDHYEPPLKEFYSSLIARYPRRSCEAIARQNFYCEFLDNGTQDDANFSPWGYDNFVELRKWFEPFIKEES